MKRIAPLLLLFLSIPPFATPRPAAGYPIPPLTLWSQVEKSDLVVVAEVVSVKYRSGEDWPDSIAYLRVIETWKGTSAKRLEVDFPANLICPAPPRYLKHKEVLAFLTKKRNRWQTSGLSYGTLYPGKGLGDYREMVRRAVDLQSGGVLPEAFRIAWLVEAAARPATRWHGLYPLEPGADEAHSFYDRNRKPEKGLRPDQLNRIADAFIHAPLADRTLPMALALFRDLPSREIDEAAVAAIEGLLAEKETPWWIYQAFSALFARYGDADAKARTAPIEKFNSRVGANAEAQREKVIRAVWNRAKLDLGIPEVLPAFADSPDVGGVGSDTPD